MKGLLYVLIGLFLFFSRPVDGQTIKDWKLIEWQAKQHQTGFSVERNTYQWYQLINPFFWVYKGMILFVDTHIAQAHASACYFEISCGQFRKELSREYGPIKAFYLSIDRNSRCTRIGVAENSVLRFTSTGKIIDNLKNYRFP